MDVVLDNKWFKIDKKVRGVARAGAGGATPLGKILAPPDKMYGTKNGILDQYSFMLSIMQTFCRIYAFLRIGVKPKILFAYLRHTA
jgi:hypothetical protein